MKTALSKYQTRHIEYVKNKLGRAIRDYKMIENGDKVLVAVSGGKDSLVLLETLAEYRKYKRLTYGIEALHIDMEDVPYSIDRNFLQEFGKQLDVKINFLNLSAGIEERGDKGACFVCSWNRRKALFTFAQEHGFKKLAFGHHMDDAVETLLMNMAYHGNIASLPGKLAMFKDLVYIIRPLILLTNKDTQEFANIRNYPKLKVPCPHEDATKRTVARNLIKEMETIHPKARHNLFKSLKNLDIPRTGSDLRTLLYIDG